MTLRQEASWVLRAQCDDREAIELLLTHVQPSITRYLRALIGAQHADDVSQEVLVTIYRKLWMLSSPDLFRPWAFRIASRTAFRYLKKERRWPDHLRDDEALDEIAVPDLAEIERAVDQLLLDERVTPACRAVLALHFKDITAKGVERDRQVQSPMGLVRLGSLWRFRCPRGRRLEATGRRIEYG